MNECVVMKKHATKIYTDIIGIAVLVLISAVVLITLWFHFARFAH